MRRRAKTGSNAVKTQRRKTLTRRDAPEGARPPSNCEEANVARELHEAREQQMATAEILRVIRTSPNDVQPVFETIVRNAVSLCGGLFANVFRFDGELLHYVASHNVGPSYADMIRAKYPMRPDSSQVSGRVVLTKSVVWLEDALTDPDYDQRFPVAMGWRRLLGVPMLREGEPIGVIGVGWAEPGPISKVQEELLKTFADQAVIAIQNTRLLNELRESLQEQTATADVLKVISSSPGELEPVFNTMLENATRICEAQLGVLMMFEGGAFHYVTSHGVTPAYAEAMRRDPVFRPSAGHPLDRLATTKQVIHIPDVRVEQGMRGRLVELAGARTLLSVPMLKDNELVGTIAIYRQEVRPFADKQIELVNNFAAQAVIAIENTRLLNELRQRTDDLSESLEQQTATSEVLKVISSSPGELEPVFMAMLENAVRICEAKFGTMFLREGEAFRIVAMHNAPPAFAELRRREPVIRAGPLMQVAATKQLVHISDLADSAFKQNDPATAAFTELTGVRTVIVVPMLKDQELVGTIGIYRRVVSPFSDKQIKLLQNFAAQAVIAIENARLLSELRQRTDDLSEALEQQTATSEVLKVISSSPGELTPVFETMLTNAVRVCGAKFGVMHLYDEGTFRSVAMHNVPPAYAEMRRNNPIFRPSPETGLGRAARTKQAVQIPDITKARPYLEREPASVAMAELAGARTLVVVPMLKEDVLVGTIAIYRQEVRPFTEKQVGLIKNFAAQAIIAIENTRLLNELKRRTDDLSESLEQQTATSEVLEVISSTPGELEPVFNAMLENATRICEATFGNLFLLEGHVFRAVAVHSNKQGYDLLRNPVIDLRDNPGVPLDRLVNTKQVIHIPDLRTDQSYIGKNDRIVSLVEVAGARTFLTVPMLKGDELIGAIVIYRQEVRPFTDKQIELVKNFAAQAVIAIQNTRLLNELRESLQQQTATADVLKVISRSTFDLGTVLQTLVESAARLCNADKTNITRQKDGVFFRAEAYGFSPEFMDYVRNIPIQPDRGSAFGRALLEGRAVHIPDVKADPEYTLVEGQKLGDYRTVLAVPMLREGGVIGVLSLTRSEVHPFSEKQIELATTFADQAAIAIENVRLFESVEARTRELAKSLENLRTAQDRLVQTQKLASLGQLTAGIAHEIKNPLNFVNNFSGISAELIDELQDTLKGPIDDKARAEIKELTDTLKGNLDKVVQHGKRADAIVKNMLLHSREGSGEHRVVDINAIVEESLNLAYHGARAEKQGFNITLERSLDPAAGEADVFPQDITRVLLNLISNGFYAAMKRKAEVNGGDYEPTLSAATKNLGDSVEIRIRDNGTGISPEVKEKLFNPFFTTKPAGEGTGLGLSISHDIVVKQHGGAIEVDTQPGAFTEFRIILPRTAATIVKLGERP